MDTKTISPQSDDNSSEKKSSDFFLERLGARVKHARAIRGMSRKELAARSNISQRYLAQLESGKGNISIALLRQVSQAIATPIEFLLMESEQWSADKIKIINLIKHASPAQIAKFGNQLGIDNIEVSHEQRFALIGLRGAGKSTLGRMVAQKTGYPFIELNALIEQESGLALSEIYALYGQEGFRRLEKQCLTKVVDEYPKVILAVAGGIVSELETFDLLLHRFLSIWLRATPDEHMQRVIKQGDNRPMAGNSAAMDELKTILTSREAHYSRASVFVDTSHKSLDESCDDILNALSPYGLEPKAIS